MFVFYNSIVSMVWGDHNITDRVGTRLREFECLLKILSGSGGIGKTLMHFDWF